MPKVVNWSTLVGQKFHRLTVLSLSEERVQDRPSVLCRCDCGKTIVVAAKTIKSGNTKSCGCLKVDVLAEFEDLSGQKFNNLTAIRPTRDRNNKLKWVCKCDCGNEVTAYPGAMRNGTHKSCGCLPRVTVFKFRKHRKSINKSEHNSWRAMRSRVLNPNDKNYHHYGGRGIKIHERWVSSFENFYADMGPKPTPNHTIERKDVNGDYCPENCIWIHKSEQTRNMRNSRFLTMNGETKILSDWAREYGLHPRTITNRIDNAGWSLEDALTTPPMK